jgi:membrane protease YdiL (CAAX protease family)
MTSADLIGAPADRPVQQPGRLVAWITLVVALASLQYASRYLLDDVKVKDPLYLWSTFANAVVFYALVLIIVLAIARGFNRQLLGLLAPQRRLRAAGLAAGALVTIFVVSAILAQFLDAGDEQGLVPKTWDSSRAAPFIANAVAIAIVAPFVEELLYRGLGYGLLTQFVPVLATILITGLAFGLGHGLVLGLPVLAFFGIALAWLRWQTGSVYPGMVVHGCFNGLALLAVVLR